MDKPMNDDELDTIDARQNAASPGPWEHNPSLYGDGRYFVDGRGISRILVPSGSKDADFIAHAREDVPRLIAEVRRLREALNHAEAVKSLADNLLRGAESMLDVAAEDAAKIGLLRGAIIGTCERDDVPDDLKDTLRKIISTVDVEERT